MSVLKRMPPLHMMLLLVEEIWANIVLLLLVMSAVWLFRSRRLNLQVRNVLYFSRLRGLLFESGIIKALCLVAMLRLVKRNFFFLGWQQPLLVGESKLLGHLLRVIHMRLYLREGSSAHVILSGHR